MNHDWRNDWNYSKKHNLHSDFLSTNSSFHLSIERYQPKIKLTRDMKLKKNKRLKNPGQNRKAKRKPKLRLRVKWLRARQWTTVIVLIWKWNDWIGEINRKMSHGNHQCAKLLENQKKGNFTVYLRNNPAILKNQAIKQTSCSSWAHLLICCARHWTGYWFICK